MKNVFHLIFFAPFFIFAQNWVPVNLQDKYNFQSNTSNYITNTIWIDSMDVIDGDSVFYLNRIVVDCPVCDSVAQNPDMFKIANQGQFLQKKMIKKANGLYDFEGEQQFILNTAALLNDSWIFDSIQNIQATVIEVSEAEIFNSADSIKTILLSNNDTIILSKDNGIIRFGTDGDHFSLKGIEGRDVGELIPKYHDFYDFEIGDVFQYRKFLFGLQGWVTGVEKLSILGKTENDSQIVYNMNLIRSDTLESQLGWFQYFYNSSNPNLTIPIDRDFVLKKKFNNELVANDLWGPNCSDWNSPIYYRIAQILKDPVSGRITNGTGDFPPGPNFYTQDGYTFINNNSDTLIQTDCGLADFHSIYTTGLGRVFHWESILDNYSKIVLIGYVKGGDTTGIVTPDEDLLLSSNSVEKKLNVNIQPNPSSGVFTVDFQTNRKLYFTLYNLNGQIVFTAKGHPSLHHLEIDIQNEPNGIYFLKVHDGDFFQTFKLVKH